VDNNKDKVLLRGVNLSGSSKMPFSNGETHNKENLLPKYNISFVNRPFPLEEADEHFSRLKHWGFNCIRFITTWEAVEHQGPRIYDTSYLDYLEAVVKVAGDYGFYVFIDPHQDVWSRFTGGDGAPGWLFEKVGMNYTTFHENDAALIMQYHYPEQYPPMSWASNYTRFSVATMFTLFFGGNQFAPKLEIEGKNVQNYMQDHFIASMVEIAKRVKNYEHVIGFDTINEPSRGYIGYHDLSKIPEVIIPGLVYSPFDMMKAMVGLPTMVDVYSIKWLKVRKTGNYLLNSKKIPIWLDENKDIWLNHQVWEDTKHPKLLKPHYFAKNTLGKPVNFVNDYMKPFILNYTHQIREIIPDATIFIQNEVASLDKVELNWNKNDPTNIGNSSHWYDILTLMTKSYNSWISFDVDKMKPIFGKKKIKRMYKQQLSKLLEISDQLHGVPTLLGEFGVPFDMNNKKAYQTGNYSKQIQALTSYYDIIDELQLNSTLWNYTPDNNNEWGDLWNLEDLSIFSRDQQKDPNEINSGGRAIKGFCRPYPMKISGELINFTYDTKNNIFKMDWHADIGETIIYIPKIQFDDCKIDLSDHNCLYTLDNQYLKITQGHITTLSIIIS